MIDRYMLKKALTESVLSKIQKIEESHLPDIETDNSFDENIIRLLKDNQKSRRISMSNQIKIGIIVAILICIILVISVSAAIIGSRASNSTTVFDDHVQIKMQHKDSSNDEMKIYMPTYIPEGYELKAKFKDKNYSTITWFNGYNKIQLSQRIIKNGYVDITTDKPGFEVIETGDLTLYYSDYLNFERSVIWIIDDIVFEITSDTSVSRSDILKMVETVKNAYENDI